MCNSTATLFTLKEKTPSNTTRGCTTLPKHQYFDAPNGEPYYCKLEEHSSNDKERGSHIPTRIRNFSW